METDVISYKEGLYLATVGGAKALGIDVRGLGLGWVGMAQAEGQGAGH